MVVRWSWQPSLQTGCPALSIPPTSQRVCNQQPCVVYSLQVGSWKGCVKPTTTSCVVGTVETREVLCVGDTGVIAPLTLCVPALPISRSCTPVGRDDIIACADITPLADCNKLTGLCGEFGVCLEQGTCACLIGASGSFCERNDACRSGVRDSYFNCCQSGAVAAADNGVCCEIGAELDRDGFCCMSSSLDTLGGCVRAGTATLPPALSSWDSFCTEVRVTECSHTYTHITTPKAESVETL